MSEFDAFAGSYEEDHKSSISASGEDPSYFHDYKIACLDRLERAAGNVGPYAEPLLDFGCGIGNLTERLVGTYAEVHAYDPSEKSMARARERAPRATFHADARTLPRGHFGTVVLSGVLHHVAPSARVALLSTVGQLLAPGGKVVVFEHNPLNPLTLKAVKDCAFDDDAVLLFPWEAKRVLRQAGFDRVDLDYIVFFPRALSFLRRLEPSLRRVVVGAQQMLVARRGR